MPKRGVLLLCLCALVVAVLAISMWRVTAVSREAMVDQVRHSEELVARERAMSLGHAVVAAGERLADLVGQAGSLATLPPDLQRELRLAALMAQPGAVGAQILDGDGAVLATVGRVSEGPLGPMSFVPATADAEATVVLRVPVTGAGSEPVGHIVQELALDDLAPGFEQPFGAFEGATSLVRRDGSIVTTSVDDLASSLQSDALIELVSTGEPGFLAFYSERFESDRVGVTHPVPGTELVVVVSAGASSVAMPASALVRSLLVEMLLTAIVSGALVAVIVFILRRSQRNLAVEAALALIDPMTGVSNRRGFEVATASLGPAAVIAIDIDGLKACNDAFGHAAGDQMIGRVAAALRAAVRSGDIVARLGGDEFVVVMPGADERRAERVVGRVELALAAHDVHVSTGIASAPPGTIADALGRADEALYEAKRRRRSPVLV